MAHKPNTHILMAFLLMALTFPHISYGSDGEFSLFDDDEIDLAAKFVVSVERERERQAIAEDKLRRQHAKARREARAKAERDYQRHIGGAKAICFVCEGLNYPFTPVMKDFNRNNEDESLAKALLAEFDIGRVAKCQKGVSTLLEELTAGGKGLSGKTKQLGDTFVGTGHMTNGQAFFKALGEDQAFDAKLGRRLDLYKLLRLSTKGTALADYEAEKKVSKKALGVASSMRSDAETEDHFACGDAFDGDLDLEDFAGVFGNGTSLRSHRNPSPEEKARDKLTKEIQGQYGPLVQIEGVAVKRVDILFQFYLQTNPYLTPTEKAFGKNATSFPAARAMVNEWKSNSLLARLLNDLYPMRNPPGDGGKAYKTSASGQGASTRRHGDPGHQDGLPAYAKNSGLSLKPADYEAAFLIDVGHAVMDKLESQSPLSPKEREFKKLLTAKSENLRLHALALYIADEYQILEGMSERPSGVWA